MKLDKHIASKFFDPEEELMWAIIEEVHPEIRDLAEKAAVAGIPDKIKDYLVRQDEQGLLDGAAVTYALLKNRDQRAYYITTTVMDKLDMLKVSRKTTMPIRKRNSEKIIGETNTYDWSVFYTFGEKKITLILPDNRFIRVRLSDGGLHLMNMWVREPDLYWAFSFVDARHNTLSENWTEKDVQDYEELIYKLLCFFYLSENEEQIIQPGERHGTRKSGKVINTLPIPVTIVTSKWNVTSIRTEGFDVSGHFRLQPTKTGTRMIWIDPFRKHGYVRHAKKEDEV